MVAPSELIRSVQGRSSSPLAWYPGALWALDPQPSTSRYSHKDARPSSQSPSHPPPTAAAGAHTPRGLRERRLWMNPQTHVALRPCPGSGSHPAGWHTASTPMSLFCKVTPSGVTENLEGGGRFLPLYCASPSLHWGHPSLVSLTVPAEPAHGSHLTPAWQGQVLL